MVKPLIFLQTLTPNTTILTPNRRLSATLHQLYAEYQLDLKNRVWLTPTILPMTTFLESLWKTYSRDTFTSTPYLLNTLQENWLWEKIIKESAKKSHVLQISKTAHLAKSAWNILKQWRIDSASAIFTRAEDYATYQQWAQTFVQLCKKNNWIDAASLPDCLITPITIQTLAIPAKILVLGFTELSPQLSYLIETLKKNGCEVEEMSTLPTAHDGLEESTNQAAYIKMHNEEAEILAMARFAHTRYMNHLKQQQLAKQKNAVMYSKSIRIGCVIPQLEKKRDRIQQIFSAVFANSGTYTLPTEESPFNISAGKAMLHYPIIFIALQLFSLHKKNIPLSLMSTLLASPFLGEAESERIKRAMLDKQLRQDNHHSIDLETFLQQQEHSHCPHFFKRLNQFLSVLKASPWQQSFSQWTKFFNESLAIFGFPGERSLSSDEFQTLENWLNLLNEVATLDQVASPVTFAEAWQILYQIASEKVFQPKTPEAPIQILGLLEAAASPFDYLWVARMDDLSWPPTPNPHPFIPKSLQREFKMPHATAEREYIYCEQMTEQFKQSAPYVIFSFPKHQEELELEASSLIRHLKLVTWENLKIDEKPLPPQIIFQSQCIEKIIDETGPMLSENMRVRGGSNVLKAQALCPFKAFAEWRLHAHALETPTLGLRNKDRGILVHQILERIWNKLNDHATLVSMSEASLNEFLKVSIDEIFPYSSSEYFSLEKKRLLQLLTGWLMHEKSRKPFKVVTEKTATIKLDQLYFTLRIDRIDELSDGKKLIIDYKTGKNNHIHQWQTDRPEEPQLPLYTLTEPHTTIGISFAQCCLGEYAFKGMSESVLEIQGIKCVDDLKKNASWQAQLEQWRSVLTTLSRDFYQGKAEVDPKHPEVTCGFCELKPLCRINEDVSYE